MPRKSINKREIRKLTRGLQREFDRNPIRVPVETEPQRGATRGGGTTVNYNAPVTVVNAGDHAQIAWGNAHVTQGRETVEEIAPGYEDLAKVLATLLGESSGLGLAEKDREALDTEATSLLHEVTKDEPDQGVLRRGVTMVKGLLAPLVAGVEQGASAEAADLTRTVIEQLGNALPG